MGKESSSITPTEGDQGSGGVCPAHESLAAAAAAYLSRSGNAVQGFGGDPQEIDRQASCLVSWAREQNVILPDNCTAGLQKQSGTSAEHEVYYRASDNRAVKRTYPGTFGVTPDPKGKQCAATPSFYLHRLLLTNQVFPGSDLRLEGIAFGKSLLIFAQGERPSIVVSQPWIRAANPSDPSPSEEEIEAFMTSFGFSALKNAYFGWFRKKDCITILDARPDNFIKSSQGVIPIDLVISDRT